MWRWSYVKWTILGGERVFSTYVEVIPCQLPTWFLIACFLHVCGGDPAEWLFPTHDGRFSPRMWRWSYVRFQLTEIQFVFSTYVEVILLILANFDSTVCFLHVCGGDPVLDLVGGQGVGFSPRMWRWSWCWTLLDQIETVFSTYVEVILLALKVQIVDWSFLHVCGGDPVLQFGIFSK